MMQGVPNLVANQESANYGPNYHARSDEFGRADLRSSGSTPRSPAAVTWGFAHLPARRCRGRPRSRWIRWCGAPTWRTR